MFYLHQVEVRWMADRERRVRFGIFFWQSAVREMAEALPPPRLTVPLWWTKMFTGWNQESDYAGVWMIRLRQMSCCCCRRRRRRCCYCCSAKNEPKFLFCLEAATDQFLLFVLDKFVTRRAWRGLRNDRRNKGRSETKKSFLKRRVISFKK